MTHPLQAHAKAIQTCAFCPKLCRFACPVAEAEARETVTPWGLMVLADDVRTGRRPLDADAAEVWAHCTGCGRCTTVCKHDNPVFSVLVDARRLAVEAGVSPSAPQAWATAQGASVPGPAGGPVQVLAGGASPALVADTLAVLHAAGYERLGPPARPLPPGWRRGAEVGAPVSLEPEAFAGAHTLIALDGADALALRGHPAAGGAEVLHWIQAVDGRLPAPRAPALQGDALYLDSCRLGRGLGVYDAPRQLLASVLEGAVLEAVMSRDEGGCCGAEGGYGALAGSGPGEVARDAVADELAVPVVIADPTCAAHLAEHSGRRVHPLARLLAQALDEESVR